MLLEGLPFNQIFRWTKICKECYENHCICSSCYIVPEDLKPLCNVKSYVLATYRLFGKPKEEDSIELRTKLLELKNNKNLNEKELALDIGICTYALRNFLANKKCHDKTIDKIQKYMGEIQC